MSEDVDVNVEEALKLLEFDRSPHLRCGQHHKNCRIDSAEENALKGLQLRRCRSRARGQPTIRSAFA